MSGTGYRVLAETLEAVAKDRGKLAKIDRLAEALGLDDPVGEHGQAALDIGAVSLLPVEPELARRHGADRRGVDCGWTEPGRAAGNGGDE